MSAGGSFEKVPRHSAGDFRIGTRGLGLLLRHDAGCAPDARRDGCGRRGMCWGGLFLEVDVEAFS